MSDPLAPPPGPNGTAWTGESTLKDFAQLKEGERVELTLSAGPWTVLRKLAPDEPPEAATIVIAGSLTRLAVPDVLSLVHSIGLEGELVFTFTDATKKLYLRGGSVVFASSTLLDDRMGEILLAKGHIDRKTFQMASDECSRDRKKFGRVLLEKGILSPHDLYAAVTDQVETILLSLFTTVGGNFAFTAKAVPISNPIRLPNNMSHYILEGVRMSDELRSALEQVSDRLAVLRPSGRGALAVADGRPGVERDVAALLDGASPIWEVLARSTWSEANTLLALARLLRAGVIERMRPQDVSPAATAADATNAANLVERVNDFLRDAHRSVAAVGGDPRALDGFFDGIKPSLRGLFAGTSLAEDGALDPLRISRNLAVQPGSPSDTARLLREGLQEVVEFALWVASDQVPEKDATRLASAARRVREGTT